jgi:hypothetical protein
LALSYKLPYLSWWGGGGGGGGSGDKYTNRSGRDLYNHFLSIQYMVRYLWLLSVNNHHGFPVYSIILYTVYVYIIVYMYVRIREIHPLKKSLLSKSMETFI